MVVFHGQALSAFALVFYAQYSTDAFVQNPHMLPARVRIASSSITKIGVSVSAPPVWQTTSRLPRSSAVALQMVSYEDLIEKMPSKPVIDAVEASSDGKVVASDVAASAGVSLSQARKDLTALASLTRGDIAVSSDGELIYSFPQNLGSALSSNSVKYKALASFEKIWPKLFYGIRVGFGVVLLASLFAIFSTIFFISQGSSNDDDRRRNRGGGGGMFGGGGFGLGPSPFDFFYYRPYYGYYGGPGQPARDPDEMGFLESTFSYIFGDGNPNQGVDEKRLSLVANVIRESKGSVTAEQLAPFVDDAPVPDQGATESSYVDESFVLPIVTALGGEPIVTDDGDIVYTFSDLQMSASVSTLSSSSMSSSSMVLKRAGLPTDAGARDIKELLNRNGINTRGALEKKDLLGILDENLPPMTKSEEFELVGNDPTVLQEREYEFSLASGFQKICAGGLGAVNFLGALYLGNVLGSTAMYGVQLPSYFGLVQSLYPALLGYAVLFNVIPVVRNFWINGENEKIRERNKTRRLWKTVLQTGGERVARKLKAAGRMGTKMKQVGGIDDIIFDTSEPMDVNTKKKEKDSLMDFDKLLENDDSFQ